MPSNREYFLKSFARVQETEGSYRPTKYAVTRWFNILNECLFRSYLPPFRDIRIKRMARAWGECEGHDDGSSSVSLNSWFPKKSEFIETLGHEMVHHYQWVKGFQMNHQDSFHAWRPKFKRFNMNLTR
tara:strand:- start:424 stop:807 length:384 start_codon:yes stop_codon:yes gene_type:complete